MQVVLDHSIPSAVPSSAAQLRATIEKDVSVKKISLSSSLRLKLNNRSRCVPSFGKVTTEELSLRVSPLSLIEMLDEIMT